MALYHSQMQRHVINLKNDFPHMPYIIISHGRAQNEPQRNKTCLQVSLQSDLKPVSSATETS